MRPRPRQTTEGHSHVARLTRLARHPTARLSPSLTHLHPGLEGNESRGQRAGKTNADQHPAAIPHGGQERGLVAAEMVRGLGAEADAGDRPGVSTTEEALRTSRPAHVGEARWRTLASMGDGASSRGGRTEAGDSRPTTR